MLQTRAEQTAWEVAREQGLDLVTILPNFVMGPVTSPTASGTSVTYFKAPYPCSPVPTKTFRPPMQLLPRSCCGHYHHRQDQHDVCKLCLPSWQSWGCLVPFAPLLCSGRCLSLRVLVLRCQFESWCLIRIRNDSIVDACMGVAAASLLTSNGRGLSSKTITAKFGPGPTAAVAGFRARWCKCSFRMAPVQSQRRYVVATWAS